MLDPQPSNASLFSLTNGATFVHNPVIEIFRQRLQSYYIPHQAYSGHSFRKKTAQYALDNDIFDKHIQNLVLKGMIDMIRMLRLLDYTLRERA